MHLNCEPVKSLPSTDSSHTVASIDLSLRLSSIEFKLDVILGNVGLYADHSFHNCPMGIPAEALQKQCAAACALQRAWRRYASKSGNAESEPFRNAGGKQFQCLPSVATWLQSAPFSRNCKDACDDAASCVSDVSDVASNLHELTEIEEIHEQFVQHSEYIDHYLELVSGSSFNERGKQLLQMIERYRDTVDIWEQTTFADKMELDYPWVKVRDHAWQETQPFHDRCGLVEHCQQFFGGDRFTVYWAKGVRGKLAQITSVTKDKIFEIDRFMADDVAKLRATEI